MQNKNIDKRPLFEKVLTGGCITTFGASLASEFIFTMTILSGTVLAVVSVILEVRK
jgi:hypothetical protein